MSHYVLDPWKTGNVFHVVAKKAKEVASLSIDEDQVVEFCFNEVKCLVSGNTNLDWLWRDYANAHTMEWKVVGPDCLPEYEPQVLQELDKRDKIAKKQQAQRDKELAEKDARERHVFEEKVKGIEMELSDATAWNEYKEKNTDPYGACCVEYAEGWAKLMQVELSKGIALIDCASSTSYQLGFLGITGFMYGCAVAMLSKCWKYGEELRKWHNKEYGQEGDGVVNPAVLTISTK